MNDTEKMLLDYCKNARDELRSVCDPEREQGGEEEYEDIYAYLSDVLDVEYRLNSSMELMGVCVYITLGGPNVWIDTYSRTIEGRWGSSSMSICLDENICDEVNDYFEDYLTDFIRK